MHADPHTSAGAHGAAVADPHDPHDHGAAHGASHGGGHGHAVEATRTPVGPWEKTPWGLILFGTAIAGAVMAWGYSRDWAGHLRSNPASQLPPAGQSAR